MEKKTKPRFLRAGFIGLGISAMLVVAFFILQPILFASNGPAEEENAAPPAMPPMPVEVRTVEIAPSIREISTVGTLQANESVIIRSEVNGRITAIKFTEGEAIAQDKTLFKLDQSVLLAELAKAKADRNLHWSDYKRVNSLVKKNAISERERDQAYALWKSDEASLQVINARLNKTIIRAPFSGTLGLRNVSMGDVINAGQDLVNLEDTSHLKVEFKIPEIHSGLIAKGQTVRLGADVYPDTVFEAEVYAIDPRIDAQGRSLVVRAILDNSDRQLLPGQFVKVAVEVSRKENALFIPEQAIISQPNRQFVWKIEDGHAVMAEITTGMRKNNLVEIRNGLQPDDQVITGGHQKVMQGAPVQPIEADPDMFKG